MTYALVLYFFLTDGPHSKVLATGLTRQQCAEDAERLYPTMNREGLDEWRLVCEAEI